METLDWPIGLAISWQLRWGRQLPKDWLTCLELSLFVDRTGQDKTGQDRQDRQDTTALMIDLMLPLRQWIE
jgi:hypothetical protein